MIKFLRSLRSPRSRAAPSSSEVAIEVTRQGRCIPVPIQEFSIRRLHDGDKLRVIPRDNSFPVTWGDTIVPLPSGGSVRVPKVYKEVEFKGFRIPTHLVSLTGAGPETLETFGKAHIEKYEKYLGLAPEMTVVEVGCGIGRDAFQLFDFLSPSGCYVGIDVTRDSIEWCQQNITTKFPNFRFFHVDAYSELYNPYGQQELRYVLPMANNSVDRVVLASVFTHLLENEIIHYMSEFRRVLKPDGLVYASFFLFTPEAIEAAKTKRNTAWEATFACPLGDGVYGNDPAYPRGAVAYTDTAFKRMLRGSGLELARPYLKGWWSGLYGDAAEDGQDAAVIRRSN